MNKKKIVCIMLAMMMPTVFFGCKEEENETAKVAVTTEFNPLYNLDGFKFILYMEDGEEVMKDKDGNIMKKNDDGEWVDEDGNPITDYKDSRDASNSSNKESNNGNGSSNSDSFGGDGAINQEPIPYAQAMDIINNGGSTDNVAHGAYFDYESTVGDYNPQTGDKGLEVGTIIELPITLVNGVDIKATFTVNSVNDTATGCGVTGTLSYDVEAYKKYCEDTFGKTEEYVDDNGDTQTRDIDYVSAINETYIDCGVYGVGSMGQLSYNECDAIALSDTGSAEVNVTSNCDNSSGNAIVVFDGYYLSVGN